MADNRYYGSGTEKALFMLSRGTCYEPTCNVRVLKMTASMRPQVNVQIAHIHALADGEARFDSKFPEKERNRFKNLILLCQAHHTEVDSPIWITDYPAKKLFGWKEAVEHGELKAALDDVPPLDSDEQLREVLINAVEAAKLEILGAIDELKGIGEETAKMVKALLIESFNRPYMTPEQIASLATSTEILAGMEGQFLMLNDSADKLQVMQDYGHTLARAADTLHTMPDYIVMLAQAARSIESLSYTVEPLSNAASELSHNSRNINNLYDAVSLLGGSGLHDISAKVQQVEYTVDRFASAAGSLERIHDAAGSLATTTESLRQVDTTPVTVRLDQLEKRNIFWTGFGVAIAAVIAIGILIAVLFK